MDSYKVLCVGGPLDGRWKTVVGRTFLADQRTRSAVADSPAEDDQSQRCRYDVEAVGLFGHALHVAVCDSTPPHEKYLAVMRALLQRDVALHLEGR